MYPESSRSFESNKVLGGVGALLTAIGSLIPFSASVGIVYIIGIILVLISMKGLADDFKDQSIFRNTLSGFIFGVIGIAIGIGAFTVVISRFVNSFILGTRPLTRVFDILLVIGAALVVFAFLVVAGIFLKRAFEGLGAKTGEHMFHTGGLILLIGSALTVAFFSGFVLLFVAWILLSVGFFSMKPASQPVPEQALMTGSSAASVAPSGTVKYCPYCGAENKIESTFCTHCGRKMT